MQRLLYKPLPNKLNARHENTQWSGRQRQAMSLGVSVAGDKFP